MSEYTVIAMKKGKVKFTVGFIICLMVFIVLFSMINGRLNNKNIQIEPLGKTVVIENKSWIMKMDVENFIPCVLMAQMDISSPKEALKAQAVVVRTYILKKMGNNSVITAKELGLPFITYQQMREKWYQGNNRKNSKSGWGVFYIFSGLGRSKVFDDNMEGIQNIMKKTKGKVMKNGGKLILPLFHDTSNGKTREASKVLGSEYNYFKSVVCKEDCESENYLSAGFFTIQELVNKLKKEGIIIYKDGKELTNIRELDLSDFVKNIKCSGEEGSGYKIWIKIYDTQITADQFAKALGLKSTSMEIKEYEKGIRIETKGNGHGFGLSMEYAQKMASKGRGWNDILKTFYDCVVVDF